MIFISYRKADTQAVVDRLDDKLKSVFGVTAIFKDDRDLRAGEKWSEQLKREVLACDVLLAVIGPSWLFAHDEDGRRRLDDPDDWVRQEISTALDHGKRVIPLLVDDAAMPTKRSLPADHPLQQLPDLQGLPLRSGRDSESDLGKLIEALRGVTSSAPSSVRAAKPLPPRTELDAADAPERASTSSRRFVVWGALTMGALSLGLVAWLVLPSFRSGSNPPQSSPTVPLARNLPLGELLDHGSPTTQGGVRPQLGIDLLKWQSELQTFVELRDGDSLRSRVDQYVIVIRPATPGHLYVFQIDAQGFVNWYFPGNDEPLSSGSNPVQANIPVMIPPAERKTALDLDDTTGKEQVFAVMTTGPWAELETALADAGRQHSKVAIAGLLRGAAGERALAKPAEIRWGDKVIPVGSRGHEASGSHLQVVRWFQHR